MIYVMESKKTIFYVGEETKPVVENLERFKDSIFSYHIDKSLHLIDEHLSVVSKEGSDGQDFVNNIVAFVGERGAGKTSCMCSVVSILKELQSKNAYNASFDNLKTLPHKRIHALKTIDPSFFDTVHNILEIIIGEMYNRTRSDLDTSITVDKEDEARKLLKSFQAIKRDMLYVDKNTRFERDEELEELSLLAAGVDLRTGIQKLIADYLSFCNSDILLISIDDIDLNVKLAYEMVEQIRKYLILPNVVILMAVKIDQLSMVIQENLSKQFEQALRYDSRILTGNDISEMAERYINKLIPVESRIYIPSPDVFFGNSLEIKNGGKVVFEADTVRDAIPSLIFTKCRYLFYNTRGTTSPIVPRNLRDLRLLLQMLIKMKDYGEVKSTNMTEALGNKQQFKRYFFSTWLDSLEVDVRSVAIKLINETEPTLFNKKVIDLIRNMYADATSVELKSHKMYFDSASTIAKDANEIKVEDNFKNILEPKNLAYNISIGDVFYVLDRLLRMETSASVHRLIFFIKALYSIKLYEWYDEMTDMIKAKKKEPLRTEKKPYTGDFLVNINDYMKLVGGNFFCLDGETVLPPKRIDSFVEREIRLINGKTFFELLKQVLDICKNSPIDENGKIQLAEDDLTKMHVVEFFMLTISRYVWTTDKSLSESGSHRYRLGADAFYNRQIGEQMTNLKFDFLSPFFTLIDIEHSYGRFNETIFGYAKCVENSLYNKIMELFEFDNLRHLSSICIRNGEILDELFSRIKSKRGSLRSSDDSKIFGSIYNEIANFRIATHDYETKEGNQKEYYTIQFKDFSVLSELFSDSGFVALFESIYNRNEKADQAAAAMVTSYFSNFLNSYLKKKQSTIISCLKKYNKGFYYSAGEDVVKEQFNDTSKSYSTIEQINGLAQIIKEAPYLLADFRSEADGKRAKEEEKNTMPDTSEDNSSEEEDESATNPSGETITEEVIDPEGEV